MEMTFTPTLCDGQKYAGTVTVQALGFDERLEIYDELGMSDEVPDDPKSQQRHYIQILKKVGKRSHSFVKCCDISRVADGYKYQSWDEVYRDSDLTSLVVEVCTKILGKITAGI